MAPAASRQASRSPPRRRVAPSSRPSWRRWRRAPAEEKPPRPSEPGLTAAASTSAWGRRNPRRRRRQASPALAIPSVTAFAGRGGGNRSPVPDGSRTTSAAGSSGKAAWSARFASARRSLGSRSSWSCLVRCTDASWTTPPRAPSSMLRGTRSSCESPASFAASSSARPRVRASGARLVLSFARFAHDTLAIASGTYDERAIDLQRRGRVVDLLHEEPDGLVAVERRAPGEHLVDASSRSNRRRPAGPPARPARPRARCSARCRR